MLVVDIKFILTENKAVALDDDKVIGECDFEVLESTWNIIHTEVDTKYQGQGIARKLVECVIENAKVQDKKLIADCSYAYKILERKRDDV